MLRRRDAEGKLMLQIALFYGFFELSKYLLKEWPSHLEMLPVIIDDMTVYHLALGSAHQVPSLTIKHEEDNYIEIFTILSQATTFTGSQFGIDTKNRLGQTPLMLVAKLGFPRLAEHMIKVMKASIQEQDFQGKFPIHYAIEFNQTDCFSVIFAELLSNEAALKAQDSDQVTHTLAQHCVMHQAWSCLALILKKMPVESVLEAKAKLGPA
jgi:ankyrin repeat protein